MTKNITFGTVAALGFMSCASIVVAQTTAVQAPATLNESPSKTLSFPSIFGVPSAVAPKSKSFFFGATYATPRAGVSGAGGDGDLVAGYTIGNPIDAVSITFGLAVTGVDPLGDAGALSISASRLLQASGNSATFLGFSVSNVLPWGVNKNRDEMYSFYASHRVGATLGGKEIPLQFTIGYGTDTIRDGSGTGVTSDGAFIGMGIGLTNALSGSISATETQVNAGMTFLVPDAGVSMTLGVMDVFDNTDRQQVAFSVGMSF